MNSSSPPQKPGLERALGPFMAMAIVVGTVIGSGVFKKPATVAENVPYFGVAALVWVLGGLFALLGALAYAEVCVLWPRAGGNYVFLREGYGRLFGFLWGWVDFCIIRTASLAALATIFTESFNDILGNDSFRTLFGLPSESGLSFWAQKGMTVAVLLALAAVNVLGVRWGGGLQFFITLVKVGSLLAIVVLPFAVLGLTAPGSTPKRPEMLNLQPVLPAAANEFSIGAISAAFLAVLWAYHGWQNIAPVAEEVRRPQRNLPLALLGGIGIIIFLYLGANLAYSLVIPQTKLAALNRPPNDTTSEGDCVLNDSPTSHVTKEEKSQKSALTTSTVFCWRLLGPLGAVAASAALMCSVFGALNGNLLVGPRLLYAMGQDGLAPRAMSEVHPKFRTPALAIVVMAVWSALLIVGAALLTWVGLLEAGKSHFDLLTDFAMFGAVIFETMAVLSIFVFRYRMPSVERPYRCLGYPVVPAVYALLPGFVLVNMLANIFIAKKMEERISPLVALAFIALGVLVYFVFGLSRTGPAPVSVSPRPVPPLPDVAPDGFLAAPPDAERLRR